MRRPANSEALRIFPNARVLERPRHPRTQGHVRFGLLGVSELATRLSEAAEEEACRQASYNASRRPTGSMISC